MGGGDDLMAWVRAQLDEDERVLRLQDEHLSGHDRPYNPSDPTDPARVLREVEAKRRILDRHAPRLDGREKNRVCAECGGAEWKPELGVL